VDDIDFYPGGHSTMETENSYEYDGLNLELRNIESPELHELNESDYDLGPRLPSIGSDDVNSSSQGSRTPKSPKTSRGPSPGAGAPFTMFSPTLTPAGSSPDTDISGSPDNSDTPVASVREAMPLLGNYCPGLPFPPDIAWPKPIVTHVYTVRWYLLFLLSMNGFTQVQCSRPKSVHLVMK
jgi:hypothetical protein